MKRSLINYSILYKKALRTHLEMGPKAGLDLAVGLGSQAFTAGMLTLDLAKLHEKTLVVDILPNYSATERAAVIQRAGIFFATAITPSQETDGTIKEAAWLKQIIQTLSDRTVELAAANQQLSHEIIRRKEVEASLKNSELHHLRSLEKSEVLKKQLRGLSRQILSAQEEERKKISRELHDVIAQALMGVNVRLATLKTESGINSRSMNRNISITQRIISKSAHIVHQFARELRPTALDDLGLVPALHSFMKTFTTQTGVHTHLTVFDGVERLNASQRTILYRVVQESLTNVARHAHANRVDVTITKEIKSIRMEVHDDGVSFQVLPILQASGSKHLGLLGMRERVEMVGGNFLIESSLGKGTKIVAILPVTKTTERKWKLDAIASESSNL